MPLEDPVVIAESCAALTADLLAALSAEPPVRREHGSVTATPLLGALSTLAPLKERFPPLPDPRPDPTEL
ncbi:MAG: hypothetical protein NVSMB8_06500 [Candidatus Limnocylindrales bacterium]